MCRLSVNQLRLTKIRQGVSNGKNKWRLYCRTYHQKKADLYKANDAPRKRTGRVKKKFLELEKYNEFKKKEAARVKEYRWKKRFRAQLQHNVSTKATEQSTSCTSSFTTKQVFTWSVHKTERSLPFNPLKKVEVIESLAKNLKLKINLENKAGRRKKEISEEEEGWIEELLEQADV